MVVKLENKLNDINEVYEICKSQDINTDLIISFIGKKIGSGSFRTVYEYNFDKSYVIKVEHGNSECNLMEYTLWKEIENLCGDLAWVRDWFAPVLWISPNGKVLVMKRTQEKDNKERPRKVPDFFTDLKRDNFGWIGSKFVCHDYGFIYRFLTYSKKMRTVPKSNWW